MWFRKNPVQPVAIHISDARLCIDCEHVFSTKNITCPVCASSQWIPLSMIVNRQSEEKTHKSL